MKRKLIWLLSIPFAIATAVGGYIAWEDHFLVQRFENVIRGDSESKILAQLGRPRRITGAPENVAWATDGTVTKNRGECVKEFWYEPASITGEAYTVGFNGQGEVVSKYHYSSR